MFGEMILFVGSVCGKAEEAIEFWTGVFREAKVDMIQRYGKGEEPDKEGTAKFAAFALLGQGSTPNSLENVALARAKSLTGETTVLIP